MHDSMNKYFRRLVHSQGFQNRTYNTQNRNPYLKSTYNTYILVLRKFQSITITNNPPPYFFTRTYNSFFKSLFYKVLQNKTIANTEVQGRENKSDINNKNYKNDKIVKKQRGERNNSLVAQLAKFIIDIRDLEATANIS